MLQDLYHLPWHQLEQLRSKVPGTLHGPLPRCGSITLDIVCIGVRLDIVIGRVVVDVCWFSGGLAGMGAGVGAALKGVCVHGCACMYCSTWVYTQETKH